MRLRTGNAKILQPLLRSLADSVQIQDHQAPWTTRHQEVEVASTVSIVAQLIATRQIYQKRSSSNAPTASKSMFLQGSPSRLDYGQLNFSQSDYKCRALVPLTRASIAPLSSGVACWASFSTYSCSVRTCTRSSQANNWVPLGGDSSHQARDCPSGSRNLNSHSRHADGLTLNIQSAEPRPATTAARRDT